MFFEWNKTLCTSRPMPIWLIATVQKKKPYQFTVGIGQTLADPRVSWIMICLNWNDQESRAHQLQMPLKQVVDTYFCQIISKWYIRPSNVCANLHSERSKTPLWVIQDMSDLIITIRLDLRKLKINRCTSNWLSWARTMYAQEFHLTRILNHQA